jgi:hypothetical protein
MGLATPEGTSQIVTAGIAGMGEQKNAAMPTSSQAFPQVRFGSPKGSQQHVILTDQPGHFALPIPVRAELEMLSDPDCKKPRLSLKMLTCC